MEVNMEHKCNTCFYKNFDKDNDFPCKACENYNAYVNYMAYQPVDTMTVHVWDGQDAFDEYDKEKYMKQTSGSVNDNVNKPKHYMLFPEKGIEVRDVLAVLSAKVPLGEGMTVPLKWDQGLFVSDYVQMMQYGMRFMEKNGLEDLKKMRWYLDRMIEAYERDNN